MLLLLFFLRKDNRNFISLLKNIYSLERVRFFPRLHSILVKDRVELADLGLLLLFFLQRFSLTGVVSVDNVIAQHGSISLFVSFRLIAFLKSNFLG